MKFCNKCGAKLSDNAKFCNKCGTKLTEKDKNEDKMTKNTSLEINDNIEKLEETNTVFEEVSKTEINKDDFKEEIIQTEEIEEVFESPSEISKEPKRKSKKKALFIAIPIILLIIGIGTFLFFRKDDLLYNHYLNSAAEEHSTSEKLYDYNKALKYNYNNTVIDDIYNLLKDDAYFETEINSLSNLQDKDKANLIIKICLNNADKDCDSKNYDSALKSLTLASKYGYKLKSYPKFDEIQKGLEEANLGSDKLDSKYSFKNNNPSKDPKDIYKYSGDYILYNSDTDYITPAELSGYNKDSLALIRNEIYARHGYVFNQEPFKSYFNSKTWYQPNPSFKGNDSDLNEYEKANVDLIKKLENN
ncbi:YARHG domain-containing protein [Clostridium chrysemydis]|uniref:YARHG domain-containing protein n=1 Tax=Clostridium chrysemydis TaxID=2665504 RepID=UPI003F400DF8